MRRSSADARQVKGGGEGEGSSRVLHDGDGVNDEGGGDSQYVVYHLTDSINGD